MSIRDSSKLPILTQAVYGTGQFVDSVANTALATFLPLDQIHVVCTGHSGCTPEADTRRMLDDVIQKASL